MASGRFEASATYGTIQAKWHSRDVFTKHDTVGGNLFRPFQKDYLEKESAPFHDLRADGCFQPVTTASGDPGMKQITAEALTQRSKLPAFNCGSPRGGNSKYYGMAGTLVPEDTAAPAKKEDGSRKVDGRPWASTGKRGNGCFSNVSYIAVPPLTKLPAIDQGSSKNGPAFRAGGKSAQQIIGQPLPYVGSEYTDKGKTSPRNFRLATGKAKETFDSRHQYIPQGPEPPKVRRDQHALTPRGVFKNPLHGGAFNKPAQHMSDPIPTSFIEQPRRPIFTYAASQKRSMPIQVTWDHGTRAEQVTVEK